MTNALRKWLLLGMVWSRRDFFVATPVAEPEAPSPAPVEEPPLWQQSCRRVGNPIAKRER